MSLLYHLSQHHCQCVIVFINESRFTRKEGQSTFCVFGTPCILSKLMHDDLLLFKACKLPTGPQKINKKCLKETEKQIFLLTKGKNNFPEMHKINKMGSLLEGFNLFVKVSEILVRFNFSFFTNNLKI